MSIQAGDKIFYIENPKDYTQKVLKLTNEFSKVAEHKISIQKYAAFLYTNKTSEKVFLKLHLKSHHTDTEKQTHKMLRNKLTK